MKQFVFILLLAMTAANVNAQWFRQPTPNDTLQPVRNLGNGNVAFSIYAPNAKEVGFGGDAMPWGQPLQFQKADNGVWTVVIPNLKDGVYRYYFTVDGVKVQDPKGPLSAETSALANIGDGKQFYDVRADIPHGALAQRLYFSKTLNAMRRMHVWTPAGYEKSTNELPVLYLIHGGGDNDASWPGVGCAGTILDNLLAEGKMTPMIVVMPNGSIDVPNLMDEVPLFEQDLMTSIIPFIEANYRVKADKQHRAIAGLSMGGLHTLFIALNNPDMFDFVGLFSAQTSNMLDENNIFKMERFNHNMQRFRNVLALVQDKVAPPVSLSDKMADIDIYNRLEEKLQRQFEHAPQLYYIAIGSDDFLKKMNSQYRDILDKHGYPYTYVETDGDHSWENWRKYLVDFLSKFDF